MHNIFSANFIAVFFIFYNFAATQYFSCEENVYFYL